MFSLAHLVVLCFDCHWLYFTLVYHLDHPNKITSIS